MNSRLLAAGAALVALAAVQPFRPFVVEGTSMTPTFASGQVLFADFRPHHLARGDVVVFRHDGETLVKRVAYLPGDAIERFWFAGEWKFPNSELALRVLLRQGVARRREVVPPGHVFVLADDPWGTVDSRTFGPIPAEEVVAVVPNASADAEWSLKGAHMGGAAVATL